MILEKVLLSSILTHYNNTENLKSSVKNVILAKKFYQKTDLRIYRSKSREKSISDVESGIRLSGIHVRSKSSTFDNRASGFPSYLSFWFTSLDEDLAVELDSNKGRFWRHWSEPVESGCGGNSGKDCSQRWLKQHKKGSSWGRKRRTLLKTKERNLHFCFFFP